MGLFLDERECEHIDNVGGWRGSRPGGYTARPRGSTRSCTTSQVLYITLLYVQDHPYAACPRKLDPILYSNNTLIENIISAYNIQWVKPSWTDSWKQCLKMDKTSGHTVDIFNNFEGK